MEDQPLVSVIVAVFNGADTLQQCLDSVAEQTYTRKDLVVMDGGSTDGTVEIIEANSDNISYWESQPDRGIYHAWNKALDHAEGDWVCFLGADDYFAAEHSLAEIVSGAGAGLNFVFARIGLVDERGHVLRTYGDVWNWEAMKRYQTIAHPGALHHKSLFERYGKFNEEYKIVGDYEFLLRVGDAASASYVDEVIVYARKGGVSRSQLRRLLKENLQNQSVHPEIGAYRAWTNYIIGASKATLRRVLYGY